MKTKFCKILAILAVASVMTAGCTNLSNMVKKHATDAEYVQTPDPMEMHGDKVKINVAGSYKPNYFHKKAGVVFQPQLQYDGGSLLLKPIVLKGESANDVTGGTTINSSGGKFTYTEEFPYKPEYMGARLIVNPTAFPTKSAKGKELSTSQAASELKKAVSLGEKLVATGINTTSQMYDITSGKPTHAKDNYKKPDNIFKRGSLFFVKDMSDLNMRLPRNQADAAKKAFAELEKALDGEMEIASIKILAWASPEGELSRNDKLAQARAQTGEKFLRDMYKRVIDEQVKEHNKNLPRGARRITAKDLTKNLPFTPEAKGEDWDGFMRDLRASNVRDKDRIINVIQSSRDQAVREQEMRNMIVIFPEIEDVLLPPLRRAEMAIELIVPAKTNEQMSALAISNPKELTVEELLFAATLTQSDATKLQIYTSATQVYSNDWRGFNNVAFLQIQSGKFDEAETALNKANTLSPNNGAVLNNLGVIALAKGNLEQAKKYFTDAGAQGNGDARANMAPILIKEGDYAAASAAVAGQTGNLNLALAQILSGNVAGAKQTLTGAQDTPRANYLKAIVAAREDNANEVFANLRKANAELKKQAQTDVEFRKYFNQVEFTNATR